MYNGFKTAKQGGKQKRKKALQGGWYPGEERLGGTTYWKPEPLLCREP